MMADLMDEDGLLDFDIQMSIQESCQKKLLSERSEDLKVVEAIKQGDLMALQKLYDYPESFSQVHEGGCYPLHIAAVQPLVRVLEMVLYASFHLTLEEKTAEGETFLTLAVRAGLGENVEVLLYHGASPHSTNDKNESPLLLAVRAGSCEMVSCLLNGGALVEQVCLKRWTAVLEASRCGCVEVLELLLQRGARVTETDHNGVTPLGIAAEYGHLEVLELLIKHGADVNAQAPNGDSVLYDAAGSGNPDCIDLLLRYGANPNHRNLSSQLPIHHAAYEGHYLAVQMLIPLTTRRALRLSGHSPVHSAADGGHAHCLELLIKSNFSVDAILADYISENYGDMRKSPLFFTVSNGDVTCTDILLRHGANPDLDPLRCLLVAVRSGRYEIVKMLIEAKADVNCYFTLVTDTVFPSALQYCLKDEIMMRLLLNNGYDAEKCFSCNHDDDWDESSEPELSEDEEEEKVAFCDFVSVSWMEHLSGSVVSVLLDYTTRHVSLCPKLTRVLRRHQEWPHILHTIRNPRPLTHLSRGVIRRQVRRSSDLTDIQQLPNRLRHFLMFTL